MFSTIPRFIISNRKLSRLQWLKGFPESSGASQATDIIRHIASAENFGGEPERTQSDKTPLIFLEYLLSSSSFSISNKISFASTHLFRHKLTFLLFKNTNFAISLFCIPDADSNII